MRTGIITKNWEKVAEIARIRNSLQIISQTYEYRKVLSIVSRESILVLMIGNQSATENIVYPIDHKAVG